MGMPRDGLARLIAASQDGRLDRLAEHTGLDLVVVFGSVTDRAVDEPGDLDVAVRFGDLSCADLVDVIDRLTLLAKTEVDVLDLTRADVVARSRALGPRCEPLYERHRGQFADAQMAALAEDMETAPMRRRALELLARR